MKSDYSALLEYRHVVLHGSLPTQMCGGEGS